MHNDSKRISANEVNRYVYCNYQWYYRRLYGDKVLTLKKKERNKALGVTKDPRMHAFIKGNKFHSNYHRWYKVKKVLYILLFVTIFATILIFIWPK